ncbi:MAG: PrsW family intramembrane metalloprotease [Clostridiales bacterium]|nr:PrsW family intramembrane metalloprotease [Clostridiales bacterium]
MLFALALIPVIALLILIYVKDKKEKEPIGLLIGLFFAGMATIIPAVIGEAVGQAILDFVFPYESSFKAIVLAIFIIGPIEELGKFFVLWLITWKNKHFNYSYDAIVYAVFVSLGFAALENIGYVFSKGLAAAILRMFTSIPGHASFAVLMGFFYSKAKYASLTKKKGKCAGYMLLAIIIPTLLHGIYDGIVMGGEASGEDIITGLSVLLWLGYIIVLFVVSGIIIFVSSKKDFCIVNMPNRTQTIYRPQVMGNWTCSTCGTVNTLNFCSHCGSGRPVDTSWQCPQCGTVSQYKFCGNCGCPKPVPQAPVQQIQQ